MNSVSQEDTTKLNQLFGVGVKKKTAVTADTAPKTSGYYWASEHTNGLKLIGAVTVRIHPNIMSALITANKIRLENCCGLENVAIKNDLVEYVETATLAAFEKDGIDAPDMSVVRQTGVLRNKLSVAEENLAQMRAETIATLTSVTPEVREVLIASSEVFKKIWQEFQKETEPTVEPEVEPEVPKE